MCVAPPNKLLFPGRGVYLGRGLFLHRWELRDDTHFTRERQLLFPVPASRRCDIDAGCLSLNETLATCDTLTAHFVHLLLLNKNKQQAILKDKG
ncbi:hypothetical protein CEXT_90471 [Caerostris extrusa]|uniref:Uncharacterized protein n=1 Tax=Caerostris extrusa TaxID=172846 RepID=A0AAV4MI68_CAEEX|nr:hypothetical protein CEXT_90471 [Caerostris extrusa]